VSKVIVVISGFTQQMHQNTGSKAVWKELRKRAYLHAESDVIVHLKEWNTDWKDYARFINSLAPTDVLVCAYSWGGGFGMPQLCKRLLAPVTCVLCDPVYHSPTLLGRWKALFDRWKIKVPKNVTVKRWLMQEGDRLDGDMLKGGKSICRPEILEYTHNEIDNSPEYLRAAVITTKFFLDK
jgi:hypothetical protein